MKVLIKGEAKHIQHMQINAQCKKFHHMEEPNMFMQLSMHAKDAEK